MEEDAAEGPVDCVGKEDVVQASNKMKTGKANGPSKESLKLIAASREVRIQVMVEACQTVLDGFGMPVE